MNGKLAARIERFGGLFPRQRRGKDPEPECAKYRLHAISCCRITAQKSTVSWSELMQNASRKSKRFYFLFKVQGIARTQSPTNKNYAPELPTFGAIARVSPTGVQWKGLALGEPPCRSRYPLCQVSMLSQSPSWVYKLTGTCLAKVMCWITKHASVLPINSQILDQPSKHLLNNIRHIYQTDMGDYIYPILVNSTQNY